MAPFAFSAGILALCLFFWLKKPSPGLGLIVIGGISNFIEKAIIGTIHDMLVIGNLEFNPADILITAGAALLLATWVWKSPIKSPQTLLNND